MKKVKQITPEALTKAHSEGCTDVQKVLENMYPEFFKSDKIESFEDACELLGLDPSKILSCQDTKDEEAYKKLKVIIKALNDGWTPDWNDSSQKKWYCWFKMGSWFGFYGSCWSRTDTRSTGSRLCFKSEKLAKYAGENFTDIYKSFLT